MMMMVLMLLFVMVIMIVMVMMLVFFLFVLVIGLSHDDRQHLLCKRMIRFHRIQDLFARQLVPRCGQDSGLLVV